MQTGIGGAEAATSAAPPASVIPISNGAILPSPAAKLSFSVSSAAGTSHELTGAGPGKGKPMQLGASKVASGSSAVSINAFVSEWTDEEGTTDAWDGDLMDVNADADDWSESLSVFVKCPYLNAFP
jgi:SCY1-like protein 1